MGDIQRRLLWDYQIVIIIKYNYYLLLESNSKIANGYFLVHEWSQVGPFSIIKYQNF